MHLFHNCLRPNILQLVAAKYTTIVCGHMYYSGTFNNSGLRFFHRDVLIISLQLRPLPRRGPLLFVVTPFLAQKSKLKGKKGICFLN